MRAAGTGQGAQWGKRHRDKVTALDPAALETLAPSDARLNGRPGTSSIPEAKGQPERRVMEVRGHEALGVSAQACVRQALISSSTICLLHGIRKWPQIITRMARDAQERTFFGHSGEHSKTESNSETNTGNNDEQDRHGRPWLCDKAPG